MMKMKWILRSTLAGLMLMTAGSLALAEEKDEKDLSAYQWGYWDKMVSPAAGPVAPAGVTVSTPPVSPPQPTPTPPEPVPPPAVTPLPPIPAMPGMPVMPGPAMPGPAMPSMPAPAMPVPSV
ncbi:MAG: late embryoproteinis abundant protein-like [Desulfobulbaceae bacterium]|nr:MAG: late embryoproteinis abundant protein-like [Desulfobulbaceae bacterium]